jgi:hypothetical protein
MMQGPSKVVVVDEVVEVVVTLTVEDVDEEMVVGVTVDR